MKTLKAFKEMYNIIKNATTTSLQKVIVRKDKVVVCNGQVLMLIPTGCFAEGIKNIENLSEKALDEDTVKAIGSAKNVVEALEEGVMVDGTLYPYAGTEVKDRNKIGDTEFLKEFDRSCPVYTTDKGVFFHYPPYEAAIPDNFGKGAEPKFGLGVNFKSLEHIVRMFKALIVGFSGSVKISFSENGTASLFPVRPLKVEPSEGSDMDIFALMMPVFASK